MRPKETTNCAKLQIRNGGAQARHYTNYVNKLTKLFLHRRSKHSNNYPYLTSFFAVRQQLKLGGDFVIKLYRHVKRGGGEGEGEGEDDVEHNYYHP